MITAGSTRGKCWLPSLGQTRTCPPARTSVPLPHRGQNSWVECQASRATAYTSSPASRSPSNDPTWRSPAVRVWSSAISEGASGETIRVKEPLWTLSASGAATAK